MTRYDCLEAIQTIVSNVRTDSQLNPISLLVNFVCELGQIMTIYNFICAGRVILSNVRTDS